MRTIFLKPDWTDKDGIEHFKPATVADGDALRSCGCPRYPTIDQLDDVLAKVSAEGCWLSVQD